MAISCAVNMQPSYSMKSKERRGFGCSYQPQLNPNLARSTTLVDPAHEIAVHRRPSPRFRRSSSPPSPSHVLLQLLVVIPSPVIAFKTWATPIWDLDVSLITGRALDSLDYVDRGTHNIAPGFARALSPLVESLDAAFRRRVPRHAHLRCCRRVQVKKKMTKS
ncbi:hypothetical protein Dimus_013690, partial [Dionaea muscipula]